MFRLVRFLFWLAALGGFVWFGMTVPLGKKTLFEHVQSIWRTDQTQELVEGTKEAARPVIDKLARTLQPDGGVREVGKPGSVEQAHEDRKWMQRSIDRYHKK
ncbi:MAG TPA: hypothetical protein VKN99_17790 [Polyangia bacterium]|nr:hypothetical protein [Polyangia bacterium]